MGNLRRFGFFLLSISVLLGACTGPEGAQRAPLKPEGDGAQDAALPGAAPSDSEPDFLTGLTGFMESDAGSGSNVEECSSVSREATTRVVPVDIIFIIDNSFSMDDEILAIRQRINTDFAAIIADSDVDYRVIMLSAYRDLPLSSPDSNALPNTFVCIDPPLSGRVCDGVDEPFTTNGDHFFHYSVTIGSLDGWCRLLDSLEEPDEWVFNEWARDPQPPESQRDDWETKFPHGIKEVLREEAFKSIVLFSDEQILCETKRAYDAVGPVYDGPPDAHSERLLDSTWDRFDFPAVPDRDEVVAVQFDRDLTARAPEQFGTPDNRNYRFHSIVGLNAAGAVQPDAPIVDSTCDTAPKPGRAYQALSRLTGGLRYPICHIDSYDEVFHALAGDAIAASRLPCSFEIPPPPRGQTFDSGLVNVEYQHETEPAQVFPRVDDAAHCADRDGWFYDDSSAPKAIFMCSESCSKLRASRNGSVHIALGCKTVLR